MNPEEREFHNLVINGDKIMYPLHKILSLPNIDESLIVNYISDLPDFVDLGEKDENGNYPLTLACQLHSATLMKILINEGASPKWQHADGGGLLHKLSLLDWVMNCDPDELRQKTWCLLRAGVHIDQLNDNGMTALHVAAMSGNTDMIKLLLCYGANVDSIDWDSMVPLHYAIDFYHYSAATMLITAGANPNFKRDGETCLHMACDAPEAGGDLLVVLGTKGAYVDEPDNLSGMTPILKATKLGALEYAQILLALGANVYALDHHRKSIIDLVDEKNDKYFFLFFASYFYLLKLLEMPNAKDALIITLNEKMKRVQVGLPSLIQYLGGLVETLRNAFILEDLSYYEYVCLTENKIADVYVELQLDEIHLAREPAVMGNPRLRFLVLNAYERGKFRAKIRAATFTAFKKLARCSELPYLCFYYITSYLYNQDLLNVIEAIDVRNRPSDYARQLRIQKQFDEEEEEEEIFH